jgi:hypothetical protein
MSLYYTHLLIPDLLIPDGVDFAPWPENVAAFLESLVSISSAPLEPTFSVGKLSGKFRTGSHPLTGEQLSMPVRNFARLGGISDIAGHIGSLDDYDVVMSGKGPAQLPPFKLYTIADGQECEFDGTYAYDVSCCLRKTVVSMCEPPGFGAVCEPKQGTGVFHHPTTDVIIKVPNAACARFWIGFQFGKWLFPEAGSSLNLLAPDILTKALESFGVAFAQGCFCG